MIEFSAGVNREMKENEKKMKKKKSTGKKVYSLVRLSSEKQKTGDGLRRQMKLAEDFAEENGYILDEETKMEHFGSAFTSKHTKEGEFAKFLTLLEEGEIEKGSILCVENLDRMSRDKPAVALRLWLSILEQGIEIVTLMPRERRFVEGKVDASDINYALGQFDTANLESEKTSRRLKEVWSDKRQDPNLDEHGKFKRVIDDRTGKEKSGVPSRKCPIWLVFDEATEKFVVKSPEHRKTIKLLFEMAEKKKGKMSIAQYLNENEIPSFSGKAWHRSYIFSILTNRAVIGEKQFTTAEKSDKRKSPIRVPKGDPVKNYYPKIITHDQFETVQQIIEDRKIGRYETKSVNWLGGITRCFYTGTTMYKKWQGDNEYLVSRAAQDKIKGYVDGVLRLDETEMWVLKSLHGFNFETVLKTKRNRRLEEEKESQAEIKTSIRARQGALTTMTNRYASMAEKDASEIAMAAIEKKMNLLGKEIEKLKVSSDKCGSRVSEIEKSNSQVSNFFDSLKRIKNKLNQSNEQRALFSNQLKKQVDSIELAIYGVGWDKKHYDKKFSDLCKSMGAEVITTDVFHNLNRKTFEANPLFLLYWYQNLANELSRTKQTTRMVDGKLTLTGPELLYEAIEGENFFQRDNPSGSRNNIFIKIKFKNTIHSIWAKPKWIEKRGGRGILLAPNSKIIYTLYIDDLRRVTFGDPNFKKEPKINTVDYPDEDLFPYYPDTHDQKIEELLPTYCEEIQAN